MADRSAFSRPANFSEVRAAHVMQSPVRQASCRPQRPHYSRAGAQHVGVHQAASTLSARPQLRHVSDYPVATIV